MLYASFVSVSTVTIPFVLAHTHYDTVEQRWFSCPSSVLGDRGTFRSEQFASVNTALAAESLA